MNFTGLCLYRTESTRNLKSAPCPRQGKAPGRRRAARPRRFPGCPSEQSPPWGQRGQRRGTRSAGPGSPARPRPPCSRAARRDPAGKAGCGRSPAGAGRDRGGDGPGAARKTAERPPAESPAPAHLGSRPCGRSSGRRARGGPARGGCAAARRGGPGPEPRPRLGASRPRTQPRHRGGCRGAALHRDRSDKGVGYSNGTIRVRGIVTASSIPTPSLPCKLGVPFNYVGLQLGSSF